MQDVLISHKYPTLTPPSQEYLLQGIDVRVKESSDGWLRWFVFPPCLQLYAKNTRGGANANRFWWPGYT